MWTAWIPRHTRRTPPCPQSLGQRFALTTQFTSRPRLFASPCQKQERLQKHPDPLPFQKNLIYSHQLFLSVPGGLAKYLEYLHVVQTSGLDSVVSQAHELAFHVQRGLCNTQDEKDLTQVEHDLSLLIKVADLQATQDDIRAFVPHLNQFVALGKALLNPIGGQPGRFDEPLIRSLVSSSVDFFAMELVRNQPMVDHTL